MAEIAPNSAEKSEARQELVEKVPGGPAVPVPEDFPSGIKYSQPAGLDVDAQRRELEASEDESAKTIKKRRGGGLSDSTRVA